MKAANPIKIITQPVISWLVDLGDNHPILALVLASVLMYMALKFLVALARGLVVKRAEVVMVFYLFLLGLIFIWR